MTMQDARLRLSQGEPMRQLVMRGLIAYYPLDGLSPALWGAGWAPADLLLTNNGVVTFNAAGPTANLPGSASFVIASNQFLSHADAGPFRLAGREYTISMWVKPTTVAVAAATLISRGETATNLREFRIFANNTAVVVSNSSTGTTFSSSSGGAVGLLSAGVWSCVQAQFDYGAASMGARVQVDRGGYSNRVTEAAAPFRGAGGFALGAQGAAASNLYGGDMAHVGIWNRLLSQGELDWLYNNGIGRDLRSAA